MKIKLEKIGNASINEHLGASNEEYNRLSKDTSLLCVDRLSKSGKIDYRDIVDYLMQESKFKHLGDIKGGFSAYEKELVLCGMVVRFLLMPETEKEIGCAAYCKNLENGLNDY